MTELIKRLAAQWPPDERSVAFEHTRRMQTRLVNAMDLLDWDEHDTRHLRAGALVDTPRSG